MAQDLRVPPLFAAVRSDARRHLDTWDGGAVVSLIRLVALCPGFQLLLSVRLQAACGHIPWVGSFIRRIIWYLTTMLFHCDIDPHARFGAGVYVPHPTGIVIGGEWDIGDNVTILQGVTLGRDGSPTTRPRIGRDVLIGAGAKIIGRVDVGAGAHIGANAVVLQDVPAGWTAVGVPARLLPPRGLAEVVTRSEQRG